MRRHLCACLFFIGTIPPVAAADASLKDARQAWLKGRYEAAREQYETLAKDPKQRAPAVVGLSRALESLGEYDKALAAVEAAVKEEPKSAALHARLAELLHFRGRWDEAEKAAQHALSLDANGFLARWVLAQVHRDRGELKQADVDFRWFVRTYTERSNNDNDIKDPDELLIVGLAACEHVRWHILKDKELFQQFDFVLNEVWRDALKQDKDFWPAELQTGLLLLERHNRPEALGAFENVLKLNPNAAEALVGKGYAALQKLEIKDAERFAEAALKINPRLPEALRLRADVHLATGAVEKARRELDLAVKVNPRDEATLGRIAACLALQRKQADFDALAQEVTKHDPRPGLFYQELAERLDERRHFDDAEKYYQKAIELRPMLVGPRGSLGLLYMRMGKEKEAAAILDEAFRADPSNVRVSNVRKVLKHLERYQTLRTAHFELRYDPKNDPALANYLADYLEAVYADLAKQFNYSPKGPILVEVFNNHEMFSGRVVAVPDLHTIGACTGRMFAMVSPNGKGLRKPFNWGRVIRHEIVHIFNLEQTNFLVPHWLTEGLAVINEGYPRPQHWNEILLGRVPKGDLLNLDTIDLGFIRPQSPEEWHLAYCQSQLYVEYLKKQHGEQAVGALLAAYREGLDTSAAIAKVCKTDRAAFEKGYRAYLDEVVRGLKGKPAEKPMSFKELQDAQKKEPDNPDLAARLAEEYLRRKNNAEARRLAEAALAKKPGHPLASYVMARLKTAAGEPEAALKLLEAAVDRDSPEPKVLRELGRLDYDAGKYGEAARIYELGRKAQPYESQWLLQLTRVYAQLGDRDKQIAALIDLVPTDADDLEHRKRLARLLSEAGRHPEAAKYARQCLEIDIRDKEARELLLKALAAQKKDDEAERLRKMLEQ